MTLARPISLRAEIADALAQGLFLAAMCLLWAFVKSQSVVL